ncbi:MAG: transcription antitermination factor NusB [Oscillospiraceae bacterium]|nr:transcription antitermination factor NusB [Oscillospiraceae bacterium]MBR4102165.1 transcription antitermination factor NusB [Oscillospiraceae bacterium]
MTRHQCRENAYLILFEASLRDDTPEELYAIAEEVDEITVDDNVRKLVEGVLAHTEELDSIIASYSKKRAVSRIAKINLILLRMAIFEIKYMPQTPVNVAVSEVINISQKYTYQDDTAFINGVLGAYTRSLPKHEESDVQEES